MYQLPSTLAVQTQFCSVRDGQREISAVTTPIDSSRANRWVQTNIGTLLFLRLLVGGELLPLGQHLSWTDATHRLSSRLPMWHHMICTSERGLGLSIYSTTSRFRFHCKLKSGQSKLRTVGSTNRLDLSNNIRQLIFPYIYSPHRSDAIRNALKELLGCASAPLSQKLISRFLSGIIHYP